MAGGAVDGATDRHPDPQWLAPVPPPQVPVRAVGQRRQRRPCGAARGRGLDRVQRAAEQVGGHDAGGPCADVDAQRHERFVVDLDGHSRASDGPGDGEVGALTQQPGLEQGDDLTVHRRDAQLCDAGDDVTSDRAA